MYDRCKSKNDNPSCFRYCCILFVRKLRQIFCACTLTPVHSFLTTIVTPGVTRRRSPSSRPPQPRGTHYVPSVNTRHSPSWPRSGSVVYTLVRTLRPVSCSVYTIESQLEAFRCYILSLRVWFALVSFQSLILSSSLSLPTPISMSTATADLWAMFECAGFYWYLVTMAWPCDT